MHLKTLAPAAERNIATRIRLNRLQARGMTDSVHCRNRARIEPDGRTSQQSRV